MSQPVEGAPALFQLTRVKKGNLGDLRALTQSPCATYFLFRSCPTFSAHSPLLRKRTTGKLYAKPQPISLLRRLSSSQSLSQPHLELLKRTWHYQLHFAFKVTCSSFSPVQSRFESHFILDSCSRFLNPRGLLPYPYTEFSTTSSPGCFSLALEVGQENPHPVGQSTLMTRKALAARNNEAQGLGNAGPTISEPGRGQVQ